MLGPKDMRPPASTLSLTPYAAGRRLLAARSASRVRWLPNIASDTTRRAPTRSLAIRLSWRKSKNKQGRTMALEGALAAIIKRQSIARAERVLKGHDSPYVFVRGDGTESHGRPFDDISVVWRRACKAAGLEGRIFHDFRRSAARNMDRAGVSRHVAMQITGHKTEAMYRRYNIVDDGDIRTAIRRTQQYLDSLPTKNEK